MFCRVLVPRLKINLLILLVYGDTTTMDHLENRFNILDSMYFLDWASHQGQISAYSEEISSSDNIQ